MDAIAENEEKVFEHYLELPENARTEVIDQLEPYEKVRFTRCSKLCSKEVQASKNYMHGLIVFCRQEYLMEMIVVAGIVGFRQHGFNLTFERRDDRIIKKYRSLLNGRTWEDELDSSTDLVQYAIQEIKYRLKIYQGSIKRLKIHDYVSMLTNVDFEIRNLSNLENFEIWTIVGILQILSKIGKPLKALHVYGTNDTFVSSNHEQIYQLKNEIFWPNANFDYEQVERLTAKKVYTRIGQLTEKDVIKFIRSWQNGTIGKEIRKYEWALFESSFDTKKLLRLLRVQNGEQRKIEIKHYNEDGKRAILRVNNLSLKFSIIVNDSDSSDSDF